MGRYQLILKIPMYINKDVLQYVSRGGVLSPLLLVLLEVLLFVLLSPLRLIDPCFNATYLCTNECTCRLEYILWFFLVLFLLLLRFFFWKKSRLVNSTTTTTKKWIIINKKKKKK